LSVKFKVKSSFRSFLAVPARSCFRYRISVHKMKYGMDLVTQDFRSKFNLGLMYNRYNIDTIHN
jgi:hypothetical protein